MIACVVPWFLRTASDHDCGADDDDDDAGDVDDYVDDQTYHDSDVVAVDEDRQRCSVYGVGF